MFHQYQPFSAIIRNHDPMSIPELRIVPPEINLSVLPQRLGPSKVAKEVRGDVLAPDVYAPWDCTKAIAKHGRTWPSK